MFITVKLNRVNNRVKWKNQIFEYIINNKYLNI